MKHQATNKADRLASLLLDYPELTNGLEELMSDDQDQAVGIVGIYSLLQLRLRAVLKHLPQIAPSSEEDKPEESC